MNLKKIFFLVTFSFVSLQAANELPEKFVEIMQQPKYKHSTWGVYAIDSVTGHTYFDLNSDQFFLPASTTKLFSVAALLSAYGDDYKFKTPLYAIGTVENGELNGHLVLVAQGDLIFGGRQLGKDEIEYTKMDHIIANYAPGVILTKGDPLAAIKNLSKQVLMSGINKIHGDILIDDRIFETTTKRGMILSPIMINENLIDLVVNPTQVGTFARLEVTPNVRGYGAKNEIKTVEAGGPLQLDVTSDDFGRNIVITGTIPMDAKDIVRTSAIKDPKHFAKTALIEALELEGIELNTNGNASLLPKKEDYQKFTPIAIYTSPPLSEYAKLILKVSHNLGADLIPLLLSVKAGKTTFEEGLQLLGKFVMEEAKISKTSFVFLDGAGGDENRLTPKAEVALLEYVRKQPKEEFQKYYDALPILGIDGSLEDFGKKTNAVNKARAKPGTGVIFNAATGGFFLTTQSYTGFIEGKNGNLIEFMIVVNNADLTKIEDVIPIFEELAEMTDVIYDLSDGR